MDTTRAVAQIIAREIVRNSKKKWASLQANALEELKMSSLVTNNMNVNQQTQVPAPVAKPVDRRTVEGSTPGDHRAPNTGAGITDFAKNQAGPRGETTEDENAGA